MGDIRDIFAVLAELKFETHGAAYVRTIAPGLAIGVGIDQHGWAVTPLLDISALLKPSGRTIDNVTESLDVILGEGGELDPVANSQHGVGYDRKEFVNAIKKVRDYLKNVIAAYEITL